MAFKHRIMYLSAREHLGEYVTHELAYTQLALRHPALGFGLTMARHIQESGQLLSSG